VDLSVVIPAYNEGHRILDTISKVSRFCERESSRWEIIVVDDGSADGTSERIPRSEEVRCLRNERNAGKGYSVRRGMLEARLESVLFTDADLSTPIEEALGLQASLEAGSDVSIASRVRTRSKRVRRTPARWVMAQVFRLCVKAIALRGFHDTQCGFKMFRARAAKALFSMQRLDRWGFDVEVLFLARKFGFRVSEVPVNWEESRESRLKWMTPLEMLGDLLRIRLNEVRGLYRVR
jgi:glycosyltransferase involved in cell wall biosynthesis